MTNSHHADLAKRLMQSAPHAHIPAGILESPHASTRSKHPGRRTIRPNVLSQDKVSPLAAEAISPPLRPSANDSPVIPGTHESRAPSPTVNDDTDDDSIADPGHINAVSHIDFRPTADVIDKQEDELLREVELSTLKSRQEWNQY